MFCFCLDECEKNRVVLCLVLGLAVKKSGAALPDRSVIVAQACEEIKRLEHELFVVGMLKANGR